MKKTKSETYGKTIHAILVMNRALRKFSKSVHAEGINGRQLAAMKYLADLGECTAGEVARALFVGESGMSEQLQKLKQKGLITKSRNESDNRVVTVSLTKEGGALVDRMPAGGILLLRQRLQELTEKELEIICGAVEKLNALMEAE